MATGMNPDEIYEIPLLTRLFVKFRIFKLVIFKRNFVKNINNILINLSEKQSKKLQYSGKEIITDSLENMKEQYRSENWAFATDILGNDIYQNITSNWPSLNYFSPPQSLYKCYNAGFFWRDKNNSAYNSPTNMAKSRPLFLNKYPWYLALMEYLESDELAERVSNLAGQKMVFANSVLTTSFPGETVATHMDTVKGDTSTPDRLQCIFFINGGEVPNTGELTLTRDNKWEDVIFRPPSIKNTVLIFNKSAEFYHGFKPIKKGAFRWAIGAGFRTAAEEN